MDLVTLISIGAGVAAIITAIVKLFPYIKILLGCIVRVFSHLKKLLGHKDHKKTDLQEAPDVGKFYGRIKELNTLRKWIVDEDCRVVMILGMYGIGKTKLAAKLIKEIIRKSGEGFPKRLFRLFLPKTWKNFFVKLGRGRIRKTLISTKLVHNVQKEFDFIVWKSLLNEPGVEKIISDFMTILSNQMEIELPENLDDQITQLLKYLRKHRCLLILDNFESVLKKESDNANYKEEFEDYGSLIKRICEAEHRSCLLITGRAKPKGIEFKEKGHVRSFRLSGLTKSEGELIVKEYGNFLGKNREWEELIEFYDGNPLALQLAGKHIRDVYFSDIGKFLRGDKHAFKDLNDVLNWHFDRLSVQEREVMYWFAINREPVSLSELKEDLNSVDSREDLPSTIQSLQQKIPIEKTKNYKFSLQPVLIEYMTDRLVKGFCEEIKTCNINMFRCYPIIKAQTKDYIRRALRNLILQPIIDRLAPSGDTADLIKYIDLILAKKNSKNDLNTGYAGGNVLNLLIHLHVDLAHRDFSNMAIWQAFLQETELHDVNFAHSDLSKSVFAETFANIRSVAFSPDRNHLATGNVNFEVQLWKIPNAKQLRSFVGHTGVVLTVAFSPDGKLIASGSDDGTIRLWRDISTEGHPKILKGDTSWVMSIAFSADGKTLASGYEDHSIYLWNIESGEVIHRLTGHEDRVGTVAFHPDGKYLASGSEDKTIRFWNVHTGKCEKVIFDAHDKRVFGISFSPDGSTLASGGEDETNVVKVWDVQSGKLIHAFNGHTDRIRSVAYSSDAKTVASGSQDRTVRLWDVENRQPLRILQGHTNRIRSVAFNPNGSTVASVGDDQTVRLWEVSTGHLMESLLGYTCRITSLAISVDGHFLVSGNEDRTVRIWDIEKQKCIANLKGHTGGIWAVAFSQDGKWIASGGDDQIVKIWNRETFEMRATLKEHKHRIWSLTFSPDGKCLVSGCEDERIRIWDTETWQCIRTLHSPENGHQNGVLTVAFSPDGSLLASGGDDNAIKIWKVKTWVCLKTFEEHEDRVEDISFNADGSLLASGSRDRSVKLWDLKTRKCCKTLKGHNSGVLSVAFGFNNNSLASGSADKTIIVWDYQEANIVTTLKGHVSYVSSVIFDPINHSRLISGSGDDTIRFWDYLRSKCLQTLRGDRLYERMNIKGVRGLTAAQIATLKELGASSK